MFTNKPAIPIFDKRIPANNMCLATYRSSSSTDSVLSWSFPGRFFIKVVSERRNRHTCRSEVSRGHCLLHSLLLRLKLMIISFYFIFNILIICIQSLAFSHAAFPPLRPLFLHNLLQLHQFISQRCEVFCGVQCVCVIMALPVCSVSPAVISHHTRLNHELQKVVCHLIFRICLLRFPSMGHNYLLAGVRFG